MARVILISAVLLALPFLFYGGYIRYFRGLEKEDIWHDAPIVELGVTGVMLAIAGLVVMVYMTGI
jgi:hypothetical protein